MNKIHPIKAIEMRFMIPSTLKSVNRLNVEGGLEGVSAAKKSILELHANVQPTMSAQTTRKNTST